MPVHVALTPDVNSNSANQGEDAQTSLPVRDVVSIWRPKWSFGALGGKTGGAYSSSPMRLSLLC